MCIENELESEFFLLQMKGCMIVIGVNCNVFFISSLYIKNVSLPLFQIVCIFKYLLIFVVYKNKLSL